MKVLVFGSCVTRDAFEFCDPSVELVEYFARSSLISAFSNPPALSSTINVLDITSRFQQRIVQWDIEKTFKKLLSEADYDYLIYDPIDERFNVFQDQLGCLTVSNEIKPLLAEINDSKCATIRSGGQPFYTAWCHAWEQFVAILSSRGGVHKLRINQVYWAEKTSSNNEFDKFSKEYIKNSNFFLFRIYAHMRKVLKEESFFKFSQNDLCADENHKWGCSPFHFTSQFYTELASKVGAMNSSVDQEDASSSGKEIYNILYQNDFVSRDELLSKVASGLEYLSREVREDDTANILDELSYHLPPDMMAELKF